MLKARDLGLAEAVYTFVEGDGTPVHIAASSLRAAIEAYRLPNGDPYPVTDCFIAPSLYAALERNDLGVEPPHAMRLPDAALDVPGMVGLWGDEHVIIDGSHRLWRRWKRGDQSFPAYIIPEAFWRLFCVVDMPGDGEYWRNWNRTAQVRTPELEALYKLMGGK